METAIKVLRRLGIFELLTLVVKKSLRRGNIPRLAPSGDDLSRFLYVPYEHLQIDFLRTILPNVTKQCLAEGLAKYEEFAISSQPGIDSERRTYFDPVYDLGKGAGKLVFLLTITQHILRVFETGVAAGKSTNTILHALAINGVGNLVSVDITHRVGELVAPEVKDSWTLKILPKYRRRSAFVKYVNELEAITLFLHDSNHDPAWQLFEVSTLLKAHPGIAFLLIDDVQRELLDYLSRLDLEIKPIIIDEGSKYSCLVILDQK